MIYSLIWNLIKFWERNFGVDGAPKCPYCKSVPSFSFGGPKAHFGSSRRCYNGNMQQDCIGLNEGGAIRPYLQSPASAKRSKDD